MKKILLTGAALLALSISAKAQVLQSDDFTSYTVGNLSADLTADEAGQGGWYTFVNVNGSDSDFQIVNEDAEHGNVLQITGDAGAAGTTNDTENGRYAWKDAEALAAAWDARTQGNEIVNITFDFYAEPVTGSTSQHSVALYGGEGQNAVTLGGFTYNSSTGALRGLINAVGSDGVAATYSIRFATTGDLIVEPGTWLHLGLSVNTSTGTVTWISEDLGLNGSFESEVNAGISPVEFDTYVFAGAANTTAATSKYDNIVIKAALTTEEILSTKTQALSKFSVFPNPATNVINISNSENTVINAISISDINGRIVKSNKYTSVSNAQINIGDLSSGVYMMTISSDKGTTTKKIVKN